MNKIFLLLTFFLSGFNFINAQNGYVKFNTDTALIEKNVNIFKGEILPFISVNSKFFYLLFGNDSIKVAENSKTFEKVLLSQDYRNTKDDYVKKMPGGIIFFNVKTLVGVTDAIKIVTETQKVISLFESKEAQHPLSECGNAFRLIIPGTPTVFYKADQLTEYVAPMATDEDGQSNKNDRDLSEKGGILTWAFFGAGILLVSFLIVLLYKKGIIFSAKEPIIQKFTGNSLETFASECKVKMENLLKWNIVIDPQYISLSTNERNRIKNNLKGEELVIGFRKKIKSINQGFDSTQTYSDLKIKDNLEDYKSPYNNTSQLTGIGSDLSIQLQKVESNIIRVIQNYALGGNDNSNEIRLNNRIKDLEAENKNLNEERKKNNETNSQLNISKDEFAKQLTEEIDKSKRLTKNLNQYSDKVIFVDYLKGYCEGVSTYFALCREASNLAYDYFNRLSQQSPEQFSIIGYLLMKFQSNINDIPVGKWEQIVQDIKDTGATTNKQLIRGFSQLQDDAERKREFQRLLLSEVMVKYSSGIFILMEEFKNIVRFQSSSQLGTDIQNTFVKYFSELVEKIQPTGLKPKQVNLFKNYLEFSRYTKLANGNKSIAFRNINDLEQDSILEIVAYGFDSDFENTVTEIILA